ncbi:unnamed protein product [Auanema sp. JU1783]|nr:unnamed protein product [Auanema sp. JU1783]
MGFKKGKKKGNNWNKKRGDGGNGKWHERGPSYADIVKENEKYWSYYREIIPAEEFESFKTTLQSDLPVSFRIQGCHKDQEQLMQEMETRFFGKIVESGEAGVFVPKPIPWYKGAYQTPMSRTAVRSHPILAQLHNFLVTEAELGNLSRQEAVSMIPPLLLSPKSDHYVLDMCAAPGSKTCQLMEMMHEETPNPKGLLIANDLDKKRCYMLIHQTLKRFHTTNCVITCEDAARLSDFKTDGDEALRFDRVLCDVICSGDGTLRKNPEIWKKWTPQDALGLHRMQLAIARRGIEKLKVGGQMVYSTCSMNPIEDEAVIAQLLRENQGSVRLVDAHPMLPGLKAYRGINTWKVYDKEMRVFATPEEVEEKMKRMICASCFPPTEDEATYMNLQFTMRIAPHLQDTGGFYVALFEKVSETTKPTDAFSGPAWKKQKMFKDEPFTFLVKDDPRWFDISGNYGVADNFPYTNLFSRTSDSMGVSRQLFFANDAVKDFVIRNMSFVSIQNAGMKMFSRTEQKVETTKFRLSQEGIRYLVKYMNKRKVQIGREDMLKLLNTEETMVRLEELESREQVRAQGHGSVVVYLEEIDPICCWVGYHTIAPYISKEERLHLLRMMGVDCAEIEMMMKSKRKEKAALDRETALIAKKEENEQESNSPEAVIEEVDSRKENITEDPMTDSV